MGFQIIEDHSEGMIYCYWLKIFDNFVEDIIVKHTKEKLDEKFQATNKWEEKSVDKIEFWAFVGLLVYSSALKSNAKP